MTYLVREYDETIAFFAEKLLFDILEDIPQEEGKRRVLVHPQGTEGTSLLLAKAATPQQEEIIGNQTGGRVFLFLQTDDFQREYKEMRSRGIEFLEQPRHEAYGTVAVFKDLHGNKWDLLQVK